VAGLLVSVVKNGAYKALHSRIKRERPKTLIPQKRKNSLTAGLCKRKRIGEMKDCSPRTRSKFVGDSIIVTIISNQPRSMFVPSLHVITRSAVSVTETEKRYVSKAGYMVQCARLQSYVQARYRRSAFRDSTVFVELALVRIVEAKVVRPIYPGLGLILQTGRTWIGRTNIFWVF
jgi:hypothetical protein